MTARRRFTAKFKARVALDALRRDKTIQEIATRLTGAHSTHCHIALLDGRPLGSLQCYRLRDEMEFAAEIGETDGVAIDLFIGEERHIGRGIGRRMLRAYVLDVVRPLLPGEATCFICHTDDNEAAIRCSLAAGFEPLRDVIEDGEPSKLLERLQRIRSHLMEAYVRFG